MKHPRNQEQSKNQSYLIVLVTSVIGLWIGSAFIIMSISPAWGERGTIGDMFGAVNALFSGLAFAALIYTIILQREEIKLNRLEIENNRKELKKATTAQQLSQQALKEQAKQTELTAKINAISTVIGYYNNQIGNANNSNELIEKARQKRKILIQNIDSLIEGLNDSDIDD